MKTITIPGWVIIPKNKKDREVHLKGRTYETLFMDMEYCKEFKKRWIDNKPPKKIVKATLTIET